MSVFVEFRDFIHENDLGRNRQDEHRRNLFLRCIEWVGETEKWLKSFFKILIDVHRGFNMGKRQICLIIEESILKAVITIITRF